METDKKQDQERPPVAIQVMSPRAERKHKGACLSCGLVSCPGSRGRWCAARRFTEEEWQEIRKIKQWV